MKTLIRVVLTMGSVLGLAMPASAAVESGKPCADITNVYGLYSSTDPAEIAVELKAASCPNYTYTIYVLDEPESSSAISFSQQGDGTADPSVGKGDLLLFSVNVTDTDGDIYVYAESSRVNGSGARIVMDRAPDSGFVRFEIDQTVAPGTGVKAG